MSVAPAAKSTELGFGELDDLDVEEVYDYERYGDNVDETTLMYCGGMGCCWAGHDCRLRFIDNLKLSSELECYRAHCSCQQDIVYPTTCCTCQNRQCCLTSTLAMPPNAAGPCNCGLFGVSCFPKFGCCQKTGQVTQVYRIPDECPVVSVPTHGLSYLCGFLCCHTGSWTKLPECIGCSGDHTIGCLHGQCICNITQQLEGCVCCFSQLQTCCCVFTSALPQNDEAPYNCGCCGLMIYPEYHKCERYRKIVWMDRLELKSRSGSRDHGLRGAGRGAYKIKQLKDDAEKFTKAGKTDEAAECLKKATIIEKKIERFRKKFLRGGAEILIPKACESEGAFYPKWQAAKKVEKPATQAAKEAARAANKGDITVEWHIDDDIEDIDIEDAGPAPKVFYEYESSYGVRDIDVICGRMVTDTPSGQPDTAWRACCCISTSTVSWGNKTVGETTGSVGDLGASANIAIEQMISRGVEYSPELKLWASEYFKQLEAVMAKTKLVLEPCDAIVQVPDSVGLNHNASAAEAYESFKTNLDKSRSQIADLLKNDMLISEEARKKFNKARETFNEAQHNYRILGDIGGCAMFTYSDQLIHIMAQIMGTMGRGMSTGNIPDEPSPPQLERQYEGEMDGECTRDVIKQLTDTERMVLTDGARAWAEPYAFMTCNAAHAIRSSMRLWGCMVEPNFDGGLDMGHDDGGHEAGGGMIGFVRMSGANKEGDVSSPSLDKAAMQEYNQGIQGELLEHFKQADANFGTVEGEMRTLVEQLRTNSQSEALNNGNGQGNPIKQFENARNVFRTAQKHARYMADVGLNQQTLNIYDLIRIQEDNFRALGRAFFSGRPAPSPPQYAELSYTTLTPSEQNMVDALNAKLDTPDGRATALEVSHVARMCCDLGHFCQGLSLRNMLTIYKDDGRSGEERNTETQNDLNNINGSAGNIETASRKIMCLVDSRKDRVCWPTEVFDQIATTKGLLNNIQNDLNKSMKESRDGHYGMTELPELVGFGSSASVLTKGEAIQNAVNLGNTLVALNFKAISKLPDSIVPAESVTPVSIKAFRDNFENYIEAKDPAEPTNTQDGVGIYEIARVNVMHHKVFNRTKKTVMPYALFRKAKETVKHKLPGNSLEAEAEVVKIHNLGRGAKEHVKPTFKTGYSQGYEDALKGVPFKPIVGKGGAVEIWDAMCDSNGLNSQKREQGKGTLWQEVKWPQGMAGHPEGEVYSYMTHYGSWLTCAQEGNWKCQSGLVYEGLAYEERDLQAAYFKIEEEIANATDGATCHHCGVPDSKMHHISVHGHDDGSY